MKFQFQFLKRKQMLRRTMSNENANDDTGLLLYVNDPNGRCVHCSTYQEYLISTQIGSYGMYSSSDGNLLLITHKDIRILNVQHYFQFVK